MQAVFCPEGSSDICMEPKFSLHYTNGQRSKAKAPCSIFAIRVNPRKMVLVVECEDSDRLLDAKKKALHPGIP